MYLVYTMYDKEMKPLYVGCTKNLKKRIYSHSRTKDWYGCTSYIEFSKKFIYKDNALDCERKTITNLQPLYNTRSKVNASMDSKRKGEYCSIENKSAHFWSDFFRNCEREARLELIKLYKMENNRDTDFYMNQLQKA